MENKKFELIISTESKVLACNIDDFAKKADQYLATLTPNFETDSDFATGKEEVKELKEIETKIRESIDNVLNGNKDVAELIATAEAIADKFKDERLKREKLIKTREAEIKSSVVIKAFDEVLEVRHEYESSVSLAIETTMPKHKLKARLEDATKNKRTIDGLTKAVETEKTLILAELAQESARISARLKLIPIGYSHLFNDSVKLIASDCDLQAVIDERIAAEQQREAEIKAKAEQEAKEKAEAEKVQVEAQAVAQEMEQQAPTQTETASNEPLADFVITIRLNQTTQSNAVATARLLKVTYGDCVSLNKAK